MKTLSVITTSLVLLAATANAEDQGEKLNYKIKVLNSEFARASLYSSGNKVYGEIKTNDKWESVFPVDNKIASLLNESFFPIETELSFCERKKSSLYEISFAKRKIEVTKKSGNKETKRVRRAPLQTHDLTSWLFQVRKNVKANPDQLMSFKVFSGNKTYDVNLVPLPTETLVTPLGSKMAKPYKVVVTRPIRYKREMKMWFDTSGSFAPLKATGKSKVGWFEVMIESIERRKEKQNVSIQ